MFVICHKLRWIFTSFYFFLQNDEEIPNGGTTNGYDATTTGKIKKWRIENSWGEDRNEKGFISMTTEWYVITNAF